jgi:hypothetical protein
LSCIFNLNPTDGNNHFTCFQPLTEPYCTTSSTWNTLGATNIINGTATLTEQSQKLSELTQAFIIPTDAKTLQFTIKDNHLITGDTTKTANDAFEVALLDSNTFNPLAGTSIGLNHTDSLLNIQANGTIHKSDKVTITALGNNSSIITIDLTQITPSTIDSISKPNTIKEGESVTFAATATDPGILDTLAYRTHLRSFEEKSIDRYW